MRILVTGGTGHLGQELVPLLARRATVRVLTRDPERARERLGDVAEFFAGDARDSRSVESALQEVDAVVSAMTGFGPGGVGPRSLDYQGNVRLIDAAERSGARRFVFVSMHGAAADHPMELLRMKYRVEQALRKTAMEWTILRPTVFMELWAGIVGDPIVKAGKATVFGRGDNPINFNSAKDVARFVELALFEAPAANAVVEIGGPENLTLNELVRRIEIAAHRRARVRHIPVPLMVSVHRRGV